MVLQHEFIEITRDILQSIGYKNSFCEKKDKNGKTKINAHGKPVMKDTRCDFAHAKRFLQNSAEFKEGSSFEDVDADFIVLKNELLQHQYGGQNKRSLWVRKDAFEKWTHYYKISGTTSKRIYNGLVYFIHEEDDMKAFKIGYTTNLKQRLVDLQIANFRLLQVYATIENVPRKKETELHELFKKKHIRGEWFAVTPDMIDLVL